jgi:crotonobetainyl-CoA:carnitine CoA-transferase CaiB-like acyl-CoA transferase
MQNVTPKFSSTPGRVRHAGGNLGANTREILDALGIGQDEQQRLAAANVI